MAEPVAGPKFVPKAVLTAGRVAHQPFEIPTEMTKSALIQGGVAHAAVGSINKAAAEAVKALEPRGPAKFLEKLFGKVDSSLVGSAAQAQKATEVFWVPFSNGAHQVGHAVSNPFSLFYAKRAGFEIPSDPAELQKLLGSITDPNPDSTKFPGFNWPKPPPPPAEEPPAGEKPPAEEPPAGEKPPAEEPPAGEKPPAEEPPAGEKPAEEAPAGEKPAEEAPAEGGGQQPAGGDGGGEPAPTGGDPAATGANPAPTGSGDPAPAGEGGAPAGDGGDVVATDQGPATNTGVASDAVGSPVPEGARAAIPADVAAAAAPADAAAGADAIVSSPAEAAGPAASVAPDAPASTPTPAAPAPVDAPAPAPAAPAPAPVTPPAG